LQAARSLETGDYPEAHDSRLFVRHTVLRDRCGRTVSLVLGDGRETWRAVPPLSFT